MAPLITGLSKEISDDTVTYIVQAGNEYGLEEAEVIYTSDLLITDTGSVVFTYPQKIS